jgi:YrhK-like protein
MSALSRRLASRGSLRGSLDDDALTWAGPGADDFGVEPVRLSRLSRVCWALDARRWLLSLCNVVAAALFVIGCVGFFVPDWYVASVTLFLVGSLLFLLGALGHALVEHGPST